MRHISLSTCGLIPGIDRLAELGLQLTLSVSLHVELFHLDCGAEVMDSPGFSSFETEELNLELKHHLPETFPEFAPYLDGCRYVGCSHTRERDCAVLEAVKAGHIQRSRHDSYVRLYGELKSLNEWEQR